LAVEAPIGASRKDVLSMFERHQLQAGEGTYRTVSDDGVVTSNCRRPERAISTFEKGAVRGLFLNWDVEITVCLDEEGKVEGHYVGAWNAGV